MITRLDWASPKHCSEARMTAEFPPVPVDDLVLAGLATNFGRVMDSSTFLEELGAR